MTGLRSFGVHARPRLRRFLAGQDQDGVAGDRHPAPILGQNGAQPFLWLGQVALWVVLVTAIVSAPRLLPGVSGDARACRDVADFEEARRRSRRNRLAHVRNGFASSLRRCSPMASTLRVGGGAAWWREASTRVWPGRQASRRAVRATRRAALPGLLEILTGVELGDELLVVRQRLGGQAHLPASASAR